MSTATEEQSVGSDALDDQGTNQTEGRAIIKRLRDKAFDGNNEQLALALGRPVEEVEGWTGGAATVDDDVLMKARGIAQERGVAVEEPED
jgi:hypothetical protein